MHKIIKFWVYGLYILPFFFISEIPFSYIYPKVIFLQTWVGLGLLVSIFNKDKTEIRLGNLDFSVLALLLFSILSLSYTSDITVALFGPFWRGTGLVFYTAVFAAILLLKELKVDKEKIQTHFIFLGTLVSVIIIITYFFISKSQSALALMGNPNASSFWIGVTILLHYQFHVKDKSIDKRLILSIYALNIIALLLLGSRSSLGGLFISFLIIGAISNRKILKWNIIAAASIAILIALQHFLFKSSLLASLMARTSQFARLEIWQSAWDSFLAHPILGYGFHGLIQGYWENYAETLLQGIEWNDNAHSLPLNIAGELGIVGLSIAIALCYFLVRELKNLETSIRASWISLIFFIALYALFQPFYVDSTILLIFIMFFFKSDSKYLLNSDQIPVRAVKVLIALGFIFCSYQQYSQMTLINKTRKEITTNGRYRKVWNQLSKQTAYLDINGSLLEINNQLTPVLKPKNKHLAALKPQFSSFMTSNYKKIIKNNQHRPRLIENYAVWLSESNKHLEALNQLDIILKRSSNIPRIYKLKAGIYLKLKDYKNVKKMLLKVKELNPNDKNNNKNLLKLNSLNTYS